MEKSSRQQKSKNSKAIAHTSSKKQRSLTQTDTFQFAGNLPGALAQKKRQEMVNNSPQVKKSENWQAMANSQGEPPLQKVELKEKELLQGKFETSPVQLKPDPIQKQPKTQTTSGENNTGLPDTLKSGIENLSGISMNDVNVHRNSDKPAQLQAHAYAQGTDIHLGPGQEKHLPHEAWHVVQQKQGRVKPTVQMKGDPSTQLRAGVNVNDDQGLEKEADVMGAKAMRQTGQVQRKENQQENLNSSSEPVQREVKKIWGKWKSSYDMSKEFPSEEAAKKFDDEQEVEAAAKKEKEDAAALQEAEAEWAEAAENAAWKFSDVAGRLTKHFQDGWGALYGIKSYDKIVQAIIDGQGSTAIGKQEVYLGNHTNKKQVMGCNILYENKMVPITAGGITRNTLQSNIFHCGPGKGAG
ncbi:DUF4157 domain-containing protein [bacterium]|nr:DUF4157 domain-containing protein [bacterium]